MNSFLEQFDQLLKQAHIMQSDLIATICKNMCIHSCDKTSAQDCFKQFRKFNSNQNSNNVNNKNDQCNHHKNNFSQDLQKLYQQVQQEQQ